MLVQALKSRLRTPNGKPVASQQSRLFRLMKEAARRADRFV